jgi:hypothetical protein
MAGSTAVIAVGVCTGLVAFYAGGFQALSASTGPTELAYVPADAAVVAYADVRAIMDSDLRQRLKVAIPDQGSGQQEFQAQTGIDIEHDIDYVVAAMSGNPSSKSGLLVARGRFDIVKLEGLAREHGGTVTEYQGKRLVTVDPVHGDNLAAPAAPEAPVAPEAPTVPGAPAPQITRQERVPHAMTIAFLEPGLVAVGESGAVKHAIDAQMSAHSITSNNEMMELVSDIERTNNAWAVGRLDVLTSQAHLPAQVASQVGAIRWFAAAGHINGGVSGTFRAETRDEQSAENLRDVVRGILALGRLQAQSDPRLDALSQSLQLTGTGTTVALTFTVPSELLDMAVEHVHAAAPVVMH